ncbi:MAG: pyruvoyl-dependent arginine decarboxylase, partial [Candidatus Norongarragalinales archaeon]
ASIPADKSAYGYLSEHHSFGQTEEKAGEYAEDLAASMLASTLGLEFDPEQSWDEKEQTFKLSGKIVRTTNITQSAICDKNGLWTSVVAAAVLVFNGKEKIKALAEQNGQQQLKQEQAPQPANPPSK